MSIGVGLVEVGADLVGLVSSVRSSNSHPDLLLTHHPTHFFRSHLSSTLDFHFLSHYSYIKEITGLDVLASWMPHGFDWASIMMTWGHLGDDLGMTWALLWQNLARLWHTLAYSGILWHTLKYPVILWHTMAYSCIL